MKYSQICFFILILATTSIFTGCISYSPAPRQDLRPVAGDSVSVSIVNATGGNVEFFKGPLAGLILAPYEYYVANLPLGVQRHHWSEVVFHKNRVMDFSAEILVTHRSKTLRVVPHPRDDLFYTRGGGTLYLSEH